jgi:hypothetical protein
MKVIWDLAKDNLKIEKINKELSATNKEENTALHMAAQAGETDGLNINWDLANEILSKWEINNN